MIAAEYDFATDEEMIRKDVDERTRRALCDRHRFVIGLQNPRGARS
jgi:hypothetical protein